MLTNSAKPLKRSLFVLMLTSALCLASCRVTRETTTTAKTQFNATATATADSVGTSAIATQTTIKAQVDSLLQAALMQTTIEQSEASVEQTLHLLLFDTTQPADTATGLPPVKAALTKTTAAKRKDTTERTAQADVKAELKRAQTDSTQTLAQSTAHVQSDQQAQVAAKSDTTAKEKTQRDSWRVWAVAALAALLWCRSLRPASGICAEK